MQLCKVKKREFIIERTETSLYIMLILSSRIIEKDE